MTRDLAEEIELVERKWADLGWERPEGLRPPQREQLEQLEQWIDPLQLPDELRTWYDWAGAEDVHLPNMAGWILRLGWVLESFSRLRAESPMVRNLVPIGGVEREEALAEINPANQYCRVFDFSCEDMEISLYYPSIADMLAAYRVIIPIDWETDAYDPPTSMLSTVVAATRHSELFNNPPGEPPSFLSTSIEQHDIYLPPGEWGDFPDCWLPGRAEPPNRP
jgi:hypothetical protein